MNNIYSPSSYSNHANLQLENCKKKGEEWIDWVSKPCLQSQKRCITDDI